LSSGAFIGMPPPVGYGASHLWPITWIRSTHPRRTGTPPPR